MNSINYYFTCMYNAHKFSNDTESEVVKMHNEELVRQNIRQKLPFSFAVDNFTEVERHMHAVFVVGIPGHRVVCQAAVSNGVDSYTSRSGVWLHG